MLNENDSTENNVLPTNPQMDNTVPTPQSDPVVSTNETPVETPVVTEQSPIENSYEPRPMDNVVKPQVVSTPGSDMEFGKVKDNKKVIPFIIGGIILVLLIGFGVYEVLASSPKNVFKAAVNKVYNDVNDNLEISKDASVAFKNNEKVLLTGNAELETNIDEIEMLNGIKLDYTLGADLKDIKAEVGAKVNYDDEDYEANIYYTDDAIFIAAKDILEKTGKFNIDEEYVDKINEVLDKVEISSTEDVQSILSEMKNIVADSLNDEYMSKTNETITVNDKNCKTTKFTYDLGKSGMEDLMTSIANKMLDNDKLLTKLSDISSIDKDDIKDAIKEIKDVDYSDFKDTELSIYTNGIFNTLVGVEFKVNEAKVHYYKYDGSYDFLFSEDDNTATITATTEKDVIDGIVKVNKEKIASFTINEHTKEKIDMDVKATIENVDYKASIVVEYKKENNTNYSGKINLELSFSDYKISLNSNHKISYDTDIADIDTDDVKEYNDLNELSADLENNEELFSLLEELGLVSEPLDYGEDTSAKTCDGVYDETSFVDPDYDDDECWDAYTNSDCIGYRTYYNLYCR